MYTPGNQCIREAVELSDRLVDLANRGESESRDDGCAVLYGIVRDCAYKIRRRAEQEREQHIAYGRWDGQEETQVAAAGKEKVK